MGAGLGVAKKYNNEIGFTLVGKECTSYFVLFLATAPLLI